MSRRDIEAGKSYVTLYLKNSLFMRGLKSASRHVKAFGGQVSALGAGMMGAGAGIAAPIIAAVKQFAAAGSLLQKTSIQTGESVENLSALKFAASQTGVEFDDLVGSIEESNIRLGEAVRDGTGPLHDTLKMLGVDMQELNELTPTDRFKELSKILKGIEDPSLLGFLAEDMFGGDGFKILPLLKGDMDGLIDKAHELGLVMSKEESATASAMTKAFGLLRLQVGGVARSIAGALAPAILQVAGYTQNYLTIFQNWIKNNQKTVVTVAKIGAALTVAGAAFVAIGGTITAVGVVLGGFASALSVVAGAIGLLFTPVGLLVAGLTAGAAAWVLWTESGRKAATGVASVFKQFASIGGETLGAVTDALLSGNLELAGKAAMAGLRVALLEGAMLLIDTVGGDMRNFLGDIGTRMAGGDFQGAWNTVVAGMAAVWDSFVLGIVKTFTGAMRAVIGEWISATTKISNFILEDAAGGGVIGQAALFGTGVSLPEEQKRAEINRRQSISVKQSELGKTREEAAAARGSGNLAEAAKLERFAADLERQLRELGGAAPPNILEDAKRAAADSLAGTAGIATGMLDDIEATAKQRAEQSAAALGKRTAGGGDRASDALAKARQELTDARSAAAAAREKAAGGFVLPGGDTIGDRARSAVTLSGFSAGTLAMQVPGQSMTSETKQTADNTKAMRDDIRNIALNIRGLEESLRII